MNEFWRSLLDFVRTELHGFQFSAREGAMRLEAKPRVQAKPAEGAVNNAPAVSKETAVDGILDPLESIPENSLNHMVKLPKHFERLMYYSLSLCLDALLFEMTLMPIQAIGTLLYFAQKWWEWAASRYRGSLSRALSRLGLSDSIFGASGGSVDITEMVCSDELDSPTAGPSGGCNEKGDTGKHGDDSANDGLFCNGGAKTDDGVPNGIIKGPGRSLSRSNGGNGPPGGRNSVSPWRVTRGLDIEDECAVGAPQAPPLGIQKLPEIHKRAPPPPDDPEDVYLVNPNEVCGCVRFMALLTAVLILSQIDTSRVYHSIRGQPFIKLYVIFNMLEICERLCRSFGRDCMDILMRSAIKVFKLTSKFDERRERLLERSRSKSFAGGVSTKCDPSGLHKACSERSAPTAIHLLCEKPTPSGHDQADSLDPHWQEQFMTPQSVKLVDGKLVESRKSSFVSQLSFDNRDSPMPVTANGSFDGHTVVHSTPIAVSKLLRDPASTAKGAASGDAQSGSARGLPNEDVSAPVATGTVSDAVKPSGADGEWEDLMVELCLRYLLVAVYILFHSFMHLVRVLSLNIAINSSDSAMFLLLVTNNFAEIKSTVFKKYNYTSLFAIVATDAVERFHLCFDAMLVFFKMSTVESPIKSYFTVSRWLMKMFTLEILIDYFKHSFLLKFNKIPGEVFKRYTEVLMGDVLLSRCQFRLEELTRFNFRVMCKGAYSFSHIPARRLGFMPSPMLILIICSVPYIRAGLTPGRFLAAVFIWLSLFFLKITTSILLVAHGIKKRRNLLRLKQPVDTVGSL